MVKSSQQVTPPITSILKRISDDKALVLFNSIAVSNGNAHISLRQINLSTKQYYSRISGLTSAGLIKKQKGKYSLTLLGRVVYDSQLMIGKSLEYYWKLKAIESIEASTSVALPEGELTQLIDTLIDNGHIKSILIKSTCIPSTINVSDKPTPTPSRIIEQTKTI